MNVKIQKQKILDGYTSRVSDGFIQEGDLYRITHHPDGVNTEEVNDLQEIQKGDMILVEGGRITDFLRTSPIEDIIASDEGRLVFKTRSSIYELDVLDIIFEQ